MRRAALFVLLAGCATTPQDARPRSVILMIGDGMGAPQISLARFLYGRLTLDEFPVAGHCTVHSADAWVTDSAAAATALASGVKTKNFTVGIDADGKPLETIVDWAEGRGCATGIVTTSKITHATPGPFLAHSDSRAKEQEIARQYPDTGVDVLIGGGARLFSEELRNEFRKRGYNVLSALAPRPILDGVVLPYLTIGKVLCLLADDHIPYVPDRMEGTPDLARMTTDAIEILSRNPNGFFLMVEGARIDQACHANDAATAALEMREFDAAVKVALDFARESGNTLVVVTADHGTCALAITEKAQGLRVRFARVTASAEAMMNEVKKNGQPLRDVIRERAGVEDVTDAEVKLFESAAGPYDPGAVIGEIVSRRLGVTFIPFEYRIRPPNTTHGHDGAMVPVYAFGPGADRFTGTIDNTDIPKRIRALTGW